MWSEAQGKADAVLAAAAPREAWPSVDRVKGAIARSDAKVRMMVAAVVLVRAGPKVTPVHQAAGSVVAAAKAGLARRVEVVGLGLAVPAAGNMAPARAAGGRRRS